MTNTTLDASAPRKGRGWLRKLAWIAGGFILLLVVAYFVATSSAFFKSVILPRVSKAVGADITVSDASISPFSQVTLRNLKVQTTGTEPLITAPEVRASYSLMAILGGNMRVDEVVISSPTVNLVENPDKSSNLDPLTKGQPEKPAAGPAKPSQPLQIDLRKLTLSDATVRKVKIYSQTNACRDVIEVTHLNLTLDGLKNGQPGKLTVGADIKVENNPPSPGTNGLLYGKLSGNFGFTPTADLKAASISGTTRLDVSRAGGAFADLAGGGADLQCEVSPTDIKQLVLSFQRSGTRLGEVRVSGPFDLGKIEGRLAVAIVSIDRQLLNLAGAKQGIDFGGTVMNSTNDVQIARAGSLITTVGRLDVSKSEARRANEATPQLELQAQYNLTVDLAQSNSLVRELTLAGTQQGRPLLHGELTSPMQIAWGNVANAVGDSTFQLTVTDLSLRDWKAFLGGLDPEGALNVRLKLLSQQGGQQLTFDLSSEIENLSATVGSNHLAQAGITLQAKGQSLALKQFDLKQYELKLAQQSQPMLTVSGSGTYDLATTNADMQVKVLAMLVPLLRLAPQPDASLTSGTVEFQGHVVQKQSAQSIAGKLTLADMVGRFGKNEFKGFGITMDLDAGVSPQEVRLRKAAGRLTEGANEGGGFDLSGTYNPVSKAAQFTATLTDLNHHGLRAVLEPMLADKQLVSVAINGTASAQYDPQGASSLKADLRVAKLVVRDPKNSFPSTALEARFQTDASIRKDVADVRQFQITLTPTARAKNELGLTGQVDMSKTNAITGRLKLAADSLDFTSYYDLFSGEKPGQGKAGRPETRPASAPPAAEKEPEATTLPLRNFTAEVSIGRLYLREVEVSDFQTTAKVDGGRVVLNPFKLNLNGASADMTLDLDMGLPGWKYDLALNGQRIPLAPFVNSFQPERKGQIGGSLTAQARLGGTGTTGASLQKNLNGRFDVSSTNLNLAVINVQNALLKLVVNTVSLVPDLVKDPVNVGARLLGGFMGKAGSTGGLADEMQRAPVDAVQVRGTIGSGRVDLQQAVVQSAAFQATAQGVITLAAILTNSPVEIPVSLYLKRSLGAQINLVPANTPTNATYAKLPDFFTVKGTVGKPQPNINKLALVGAALTGIGGGIQGTGGILQEVGGLLTGQPRGGTNAAGRTGASASTNRVNSLLQGLGGLLQDNTAGGNAQTNQPGTNQSPVNNLIDGLFGPKKK
jgi:uncharacterized protein involved in outer membrane biogenesis